MTEIEPPRSAPYEDQMATGWRKEIMYRVRVASLADADILVRHRVNMFKDMGVTMDVPAVEATFRQWLAAMMPSVYRAWLVEAEAGDVVSGGGITVLPWPPGPRVLGDRLAFVYNVYTEPAHRHRGLARLVMTEIHAWCRANSIWAMRLNASPDGRPLYASMGYTIVPNPMMSLTLR